MSFILQKEKQEGERKRIEAAEKLALSNNTKVVVIGNPKNGLPLVLEPERPVCWRAFRDDFLLHDLLT